MIRREAAAKEHDTSSLTDRECDRIIESFSEQTLENIASRHMTRENAVITSSNISAARGYKL